MNDLLRRKAALEKTLAKYRQRKCDFVNADCARLLRYHLLQMGHKPPPMPRYRSLTGAARALQAVGGLETVLDGMLPRIPWAKMLPGDVAIMAGEGGMDAGVICLGHKVGGWFEGYDEMANMTPISIKAAWRA
jgi:hypothetical protein